MQRRVGVPQIRCLLAAGFMFYTMEEYTVSSSHHGDCDRETHWRHHSSLLRRRSLLSIVGAFRSLSNLTSLSMRTKVVSCWHAPARLRTLIANTTGYSTKEFPVKYLGIPLISGRCKKAFFWTRSFVKFKDGVLHYLKVEKFH